MPDLSPRRQHPAWIFLSAIQQLRGLAIPLVVLLIGGGRRGDETFLALGGAAVLLGAAARAVAWWQFRYEVTGGELRVRSGLLAKRERFVPLERVQAVDVNETPLQRLLGVVGLRVETAAGGSAESDVTLSALSRAEAELLRGRLALGRAGGGDAAAAATGEGAQAAAGAAPTTAPSPAAAGELIRRITPGELLAAGATSGRIAPALAVFSFAFQLADDVVPDEWLERLAMTGTLWSIRGVLTLVGVVAVGAWLLAIASTALTFGGFELRRDGERLQVAYGLLERRRRSIPIARIQAVTVSEGLLRQPLGLAAVRFESAGYGTDTAESGVLFPLLRRAEVPTLLAAATPGFAAAIEPAGLAPPPPRARRRYVVADALPLVVLAAVAVAILVPVPWGRWWWGLALLTLAPLGALHGWLRFRDTGWALDGAGRLVARGGGVERRTTIVPRRRLQRRSLAQDPFQRRAALATFGAAVASGGGGGVVRLEHLDAGVATELVGRLATKVRRDGPTAPGTGHPITGEDDGAPVAGTQGGAAVWSPGVHTESG